MRSTLCGPTDSMEDISCLAAAECRATFRGFLCGLVCGTVIWLAGFFAFYAFHKYLGGE